MSASSEMNLVARESHLVPDELCAAWVSAAINPERVGYYQVRSNVYTDRRNSSHLMGSPFRFWDGTCWRPYEGDTEISIFGKFPNHEWRGLLKNHKSGEALGHAVNEHVSNTKWQKINPARPEVV